MNKNFFIMNICGKKKIICRISKYKGFEDYQPFINRKMWITFVNECIKIFLTIQIKKLKTLEFTGVLGFYFVLSVMCEHIF